MTKSPGVVGAIFLAVLLAVSVLPASGASNSSAKDEAGAGGEDDRAPRVAVADFGDNSRARIDNLGPGFATKLSDRLAEDGIRIIDRGEIETVMQEGGLDPTSLGDLAFAARELGVDFLVTGAVERVVIDTTSLSVLLVTVTSAEARVDARAELIDPSMAAVASAVTATGTGKESSSLAVRLGDLFPSTPPCDVCEGGVRIERDIVPDGDLVSIGYVNPSTPGWLGFEVVAADGTFLRWLGWRFVARGACETWFWNQRDALGVSVGPGVYAVRLRSGDSVVGEVTFQIRPSVALVLPSLDLVTVGTTAFDAGSVGQAIDDAVSQLAASLVPAILARGTSAGPRAATASPAESPLLAQIAAVLPDGRATLSAGASHGVAVGDRFEVLTVDRLTFDPSTLAVLSYDIVATKGQIEIVEVRDWASTGVLLGTFEPMIGDLARAVP